MSLILYSCYPYQLVNHLWLVDSPNPRDMLLLKSRHGVIICWLPNWRSCLWLRDTHVTTVDLYCIFPSESELLLLYCFLFGNKKNTLSRSIKACQKLEYILISLVMILHQAQGSNWFPMCLILDLTQDIMFLWTYCSSTGEYGVSEIDSLLCLALILITVLCIIFHKHIPQRIYWQQNSNNKIFSSPWNYELIGDT